ncbi:DUF6544 family protein [Thermoactinospora rubra]|uniref:DUF6544 family protein n=1 Tax=Thermoactinospora rubra TaxID=1088767 RepID=UPI000A102EE7|nr:DUF6544 family protein [Thermoactinospora rubra]
MSVVIPPAHLTEEARSDWHDLQVQTRDPAPFDPGNLGHLPEPARRWLRHAIRPGTPLRRAVVLDSHGAIRIGSAWRSFRAHQVLAPPAGYVWAARAWFGPLPVHGFDRYRRGVGEMRWRVLDLVPVLSARDDDVARSAAGRLAAEFVLVPAVALDPAIVWKAVDDRQVGARVAEHDVTLEVGPEGVLESVSLRRWHDGHDEDFRATFTEEGTYDGFTIPVEARCSWSGDEFIWFHVDQAIYR